MGDFEKFLAVQCPDIALEIAPIEASCNVPEVTLEVTGLIPGGASEASKKQLL
jgi:hypothetical protein